MSSAERVKLFEPLGYTRLRILGCLGGDMPSLPWYLDLGAEEDVFIAFRTFVQRMIQICATEKDRATRALIGAARLLIGDVSGADEVLDNLPPPPVKHQGRGYCLVVPMQAMRTALPLPANLPESSHWYAGSGEEAVLRAWLAQHRHQLAWDEARGEYRIISGNVEPGKSS